MKQLKKLNRPLVISVFLGIIGCCLFLPAACSKDEPSQAVLPNLEQLNQIPQSGYPQPETDDGQWVMPAKNYASTRFSSLNEINAENVKNLQLSWTFSTGLTNGHEAAPIVVNNTMYIITPYPTRFTRWI